MPLYIPPPGRPKPYVSPGVAAKPELAPIPQITLPYRACDECGYSKVDEKPISRAMWQVEVPGGTLYFCDHHYHDHELSFLAHSYPVSNISDKVAPQ